LDGGRRVGSVSYGWHGRLQSGWFGNLTLPELRSLSASPWDLPFEGDAGLVERDQPRVGDRDAVSVAGEIGEHGLRSGEGFLGVDDPLGAAQRRERGVEDALVGERIEIAEEGQAAGLMQGRESLEKEAAEQAGEDAHGQEETGPAGDPARPVRRQAAAGDDDVDMRMMG
jgi:hypothetical protein